MKIQTILLILLVTFITCNKENKNDLQVFLSELSDFVTDFLPNAKVKLEDKIYEKLNNFETKLNSLNKKELIRLAVQLERHLDKNLIGGIHDKISKMSYDDALAYVKTKYNDNKEKLENFNFDKFFNGNFELKFLDELNNLITDNFKDNSVKNYIDNLKRDNLIELALQIEEYERREKLLIGGLHDFIHRLSDEEIKDKIATKLENNPELNHISKLENLNEINKQYKLNKNLKEEAKPNDNNNKKNNKNYFNGRLLVQISDEISEYINVLKREDLIQLNINLENYFRKKELKELTLKDKTTEEIKNNVISIINEHANSFKTISDLYNYYY